MNFDPKELFSSALGALQQHVPTDMTWLPLASAGAVALIGLVLLLKGAKMAPFIAGLAVLIGAVGGGAAISQNFGTPLMPTLVTTGLVGFVLGIMLFRLMQAAFLASCLVGIALSVYYVRDLNVHLQNYTSQNLTAGEITLPEPGAAAMGHNLAARASDVWQYLGAHVPNFQTNFWSLVVITGITGLLLGWLVPRVTRAACAATFGTLLLFAGGASLLQLQSPQTFEQVQQWTQANMGPWTWAPLGAIWLSGLIHNFRQGRTAAAKAADAEAAAKPAVA